MVIKKEGIFRYRCPILNSFCFYIPLQRGSHVIAVLGILPTIACFYFSSSLGFEFLERYGIPTHYSPGVECIYGILALLVLSSHIVLTLSVLLRLRKLILTYLFALSVYIIVSFGLAVVIAVEAIKGGHSYFGISYIFLATLYTLILIYFWIVIQSQLFTEKKENNVIKINITIL